MQQILTLAFMIAVSWTSLLAAQQELDRTVIVEGPVLNDGRTAEPLIAPDLAEEVIPAPVEAPMVLPASMRSVPVHAIKYNIRPSARRVFACHGKIDTVLAVDNPADRSGCLYEVPVSLPGCCRGEPVARTRRGLFGRAVVEYSWPCGFEIEIIFRHRGDLAVKFNAD
jgi:hypothetical protein